MLHTGTAKSMVTAQHRPSRRDDADISTSATKENERRLHALRGASGLSQKIISRFLDFRPHAAINRESAMTNESAAWPIQRLSYGKPTPVQFNARGAAPLPYGHVLIENCVDPNTNITIGTAAVIPSEWPLQIAPSQFQLRDAHGAKLNVTRAYEVSYVRRETTVAALLADVQGFLNMALRMTPTAVEALQIIIARREKSAYVPLHLASAAASDVVDLFNLGGSSFEKEGEELAIITPDMLLPLRPHVAPPNAPNNPPPPNLP
eukprot:7379288-Prymnesium_polylepis.1